MDILDILKKAAESQAADIFIVCGAVLSFKANGRMYELDGNALSPEDTKNLVLQIFHLAKRDITEEQLPEREKDFSLSDRKSTRLNSSHNNQSRMPSSA